MQVWRRGVSRVAEPPQLLIGFDPLTGDDPDAIPLEVGVKGEDPVSMIENDEIAVDVAHGDCLRVGQGAWCLIGHRQPPLGVGRTKSTANRWESNSWPLMD